MELFYSTFSSGKMSLDARSLVEEGFVRYDITVCNMVTAMEKVTLIRERQKVAS
jgi:hypothetical protein